MIRVVSVVIVKISINVPIIKRKTAINNNRPFHFTLWSSDLKHARINMSIVINVTARENIVNN